MSAPSIQTGRLILRKFTPRDMEALFQILKDEEVNTFLPWYPVRTMAETVRFYEERFASNALAYAICLREDDKPIGYIQMWEEEPYDLGYGLRREFWHQGIAGEAARAVMEQAKKAGVPYVTATHDRNNPRSGGVMKKAGMRYQYSYEEQWQPKNIPVVFRMYQLNLQGDESFVYRKYKDEAPAWFVEPDA